MVLPKGLTRHEERMIKEILSLGKTPVSRIMIPKVDMVACPADLKVSDLIKQFNESGHSRVPVFCDTIDNIIGIAYLKDIFRILSVGRDRDISGMSAVEFVRMPHFAYERISGLDAFLEMQRQKISIRIVIDEFGAVVGLVTLEDLLEEIVGEMADEFAREQDAGMTRTGEGRYLVEPKTALDKFVEVLGVELPAVNASTVAGLIYHLADRIPKVGERIPFGEWEFAILEGTSRKITKVSVEKAVSSKK